MINIKTLEELRTKEELINYFKQLGKNITEEKINKLKQSYNKAQINGDTLTLEQLDDVVGGADFYIYLDGKPYGESRCIGWSKIDVIRTNGLLETHVMLRADQVELTLKRFPKNVFRYDDESRRWQNLASDHKITQDEIIRQLVNEDDYRVIFSTNKSVDGRNSFVNVFSLPTSLLKAHPEVTEKLVALPSGFNPKDLSEIGEEQGKLTNKVDFKGAVINTLLTIGAVIIYTIAGVVISELKDNKQN